MNVMVLAIHWIESTFRSIPFPLLEVWGRLSFVIGLILAVIAFSGFTFRPAGNWGLARERQVWDSQALWGATLTFMLVPLTGWIGSSIVLVEGAQTLESLKDMSVAMCLMLFGYPALVVLPFAYIVADLIAGTPPDFVMNWIWGYFTSRAYFWILYQFVGKNPDFKRLNTWLWYGGFVAIEMLFDPQQWGYLCSEKFTPEISYRAIVPAYFFTLCITWAMVPFAMLAALPLARRFGMFWAEIPGHVSERLLGQKMPVWVSGLQKTPTNETLPQGGIPIRLLVATPFIILMLGVVSTTAYLTLTSSQQTAEKLTLRLHHEIADNINLKMDDLLEKVGSSSEVDQIRFVNAMLRNHAIVKQGRAFIVDWSGQLIATSQGREDLGSNVLASASESADPVVKESLRALSAKVGELRSLKEDVQFNFDVVTEKPLSRQTWLSQATPYVDKKGEHTHWIIVTSMPDSYYLEGVFKGNGQAALVIAYAVVALLVLVAILSALVTRPLQAIARASGAMADGDLSQRIKVSRIAEFDMLALSFNAMAQHLQTAFQELLQHRNHMEDLVRDRTSELEKSKERLQAAGSAGIVGVWEWNVVDNLLVWDKVMYQLYGIREEDFTGAYDAWARIIHPDDKAYAEGEIQAALRGEREYAPEFRVIWPDGSIHYIKAASHTTFDSHGRPLRMVGVNYEQTAQKKVEQSLAKARDAAEAAKRAAEEANSAKSIFLANMSHELRTPLNAILGFSEMLQRDPGISERQQTTLEIIHKSGDHLLGLINDVLDIAKIEAGRTQLDAKPFDLGAMVQDVTDMLRVRAEDKGLKLLFEPTSDFPRCIVGDEAKLRQIIINLLSNAIRATDEGGVTLRLGARHDAEEYLVIEVEDTGYGILPEDQARIFDAFVQVGAQAAQQGTGLGLAITRQFAELMGGSIRATSSLGHGSVFRVEVKARPALAEEIPRVTPISGKVMGLEAGQAPCRVLVVDDQPDNLLLLTSLLQSVGLAVRQAVNGAEALDQFAQWQPHFIWMDRRMPVMDGLEATRRIRNLPEGQAVKIVAITASTFQDEDKELTGSGFDAVVHKPFRAHSIFGCMERLLGLRFVRDQATEAPPPLQLTAGALAAIPDPLRLALREALVLLDSERILQLIQEIAQWAPDIAAPLKRLAQSYNYNAILEALDRLA